jgi:hypothetical protein
MFTLEELKLLTVWYELMTDFYHSDKETDTLIDKINTLITDMEEPI